MFKSKIVKHHNFTKKQLNIVYLSLKKLDKILNSKKFKSKIINHTCLLTEKKEFLANNGFSNQDIYTKIIHGAEFSIYLDHDNYKKGNIGYTYPNGQTICTYAQWFNKYGEESYHVHLAHEWCHKIGFDHDMKRTEERNFSVPYAVHKIVEELS